jgi:membrane protein involved in colicin uptake
MLADTIERVNKLRKQALKDPEFIRSSKEHARNIALNQRQVVPQSRKIAEKKPKRFDKAYQQSEFGVNTSGVTH